MKLSILAISHNIDSIEQKHKGYLHFLYWYAIKTLVLKASLADIAVSMNEESKVPLESRMPLNLTRRQVNNWLYSNGGKEYPPTDKSLDTGKHQHKRLVWVRTHYSKITNQFEYVYYLNEKGFYITNQQNKIKKLPKWKNEEEGIK